MALLIGGLALGYLLTRIPHQQNNPMGAKPQPGDSLPPVNIYNPAASDAQRTLSTMYNPNKIGYTDPYIRNKVRGPYSNERPISNVAADRQNAPFKSQKARENSVRTTGAAYSRDHVFLDDSYKYKGVKPHPKVNSLGTINYTGIVGYPTPTLSYA